MFVSALIALLIFVVICVVLFYCVRLLRPQVGEPWGTIILVIAIILALIGFITYVVPVLAALA